MTEETEIKVEIAQIRSDMGYLKKAIAGNGEPGLLHETRENTEFRIKAEAQLGFVKWLTLAVGGTAILSVANLIKTIIN